MAIVFPASPSINETFTEGSITYKCVGTNPIKWIGLGVTPADRLVEGSNSLEITAGNDLVWTGDNIGINDTSPDNKLHITTTSSSAYSTNTTNTSNLTNALLKLQNLDGGDGTGVNNYVGIQFSVANGATSTAQLQYVRTGDNSGKFEFKARNTSTSYPNIMTLLSSGDMGLGTDNPTSDGGVTLEIKDDSTPTLKLNDGGEYKALFQLRGNDLEIRGSNGVMEFYTGNVDGASSTKRLSITSAGLVNITGGIQVTENVTPTSGRGIEIFEAGTGIGQISSLNRDANSWDELRIKGSEVKIYTGNSNGIGLDLAAAQSTLYGTSDGILNLDSTNAGGSFMRFKQSGTTKCWVGSAEQMGGGTGADQDDLGLRAVGNIILRANGAERLRINENGRVDIGDELGVTHAGQFQVIHTGGGQQDNDALSFFETDAQDWIIMTNYNTSGTHYHMRFMQQGGVKGAIYGSSGADVQYAGSSDYRLKENIVEITGTQGIDICKKLKPSYFNWIENRIQTGETNTVDGFIAHEVQEAGLLGVVTGEKDAVNEDGSINGQMMDYGKMTPVLAAAIKGLISKVEDLEQRLSAASL